MDTADALGRSNDDVGATESSEWTTRLSLCLASSVVRNGDKDWTTVAHSIKPFCNPKKLPECFTPKDCAQQYSKLRMTMEHRAEGETPEDFLVKSLANSRLEELQTTIAETKEVFKLMSSFLKMNEAGELDESDLDAFLLQLESQENCEEQFTGWTPQKERSPVKRQPGRTATSPSLIKKSPGKGKGKGPKTKEISRRGSLNLDSKEHDAASDFSIPDSPLEASKIASKISPRPTSSPQPFFNPSSVLASAAAHQLPLVPTSISHAHLLGRRSDLHDANSPALNPTSLHPVSSVTLSAPTLSKLLEMPPSVPGKLPPLPTVFYSSDTVSPATAVQRASDVSLLTSPKKNLEPTRIGEQANPNPVGETYEFPGNFGISSGSEQPKSGLFMRSARVTEKDSAGEKLSRTPSVESDKERSPFKFRDSPEKQKSANQKSPSPDKRFTSTRLSSDGNTKSRNLSYTPDPNSSELVSRSFTFSSDDLASDNVVAPRNANVRVAPGNIIDPPKTPIDRKQKKRRFFTSRDYVSADDSEKATTESPEKTVKKAVTDEKEMQSSKDTKKVLSFKAENICQSPNEAIDFLKELDSIERKVNVTAHSSGVGQSSNVTSIPTNFTPDSFLKSDNEKKQASHFHETKIFNVDISGNELHVPNLEIREKLGKESMSTKTLDNLLSQGAVGSNMQTSPIKDIFADNKRTDGAEIGKVVRPSLENIALLQRSSSAAQDSTFKSPQVSSQLTAPKYETTRDNDAGGSTMLKLHFRDLETTVETTNSDREMDNMEFEDSSNELSVATEHTLADVSESESLSRPSESSDKMEDSTAPTSPASVAEKQSAEISKTSARKPPRKNARKNRKGRSAVKRAVDEDESSQAMDTSEDGKPDSQKIEHSKGVPYDAQKKLSGLASDDGKAMFAEMERDGFRGIIDKSIAKTDEPTRKFNDDHEKGILSRISDKMEDASLSKSLSHEGKQMDDCSSASPASTTAITTEDIFAKYKETSKDPYSNKQWSPQSSSRASQSMVTPTTSDMSDETENTGDSDETDQTANSSENAFISKKAKMKRKDRDLQHEYKTWKKSISIVWREAANHKYANVFSQRVTDDVAPGYQSIVKRPMDLTSIKKNIDNGIIQTTEEFQRDMMLMFQNAIMYNSSDHDVFEMAVEMQKDVSNQIQDYLGTQIIMEDKMKDTSSLSKSLRTVRRVKTLAKPQRLP